jgi:hypothetical protein
MAEFEAFEVRSLGDLVDQCTPKERDTRSGRVRNYSVYRGASRLEGGLLTSLDRLGGIDPPHTKAHLEEHIFRNFIRYGRPFFPKSHTNDWELLVTAEHHGLPTRLLDWSYSPLVAAHFATSGPARECDRVIWQLDWRMLHEHFGLKPLAFLVSDLGEFLQERGYQSPWDLFEAKPKEQLFVCMLEPPALDERIMAQAAAFTLASVKSKAFDQMLHDEGIACCLRQFVIPAGRNDFIRDQLDMCGLDERRLFPGLDGVAAELRRYYAASAEKG